MHRKSLVLLPVLSMTLAMACDDPSADGPADERGCSPGFVDTADGCEFSEEAVIEVMRTFDDGQLVKVNRVPFEQTLGVRVERNVWISPLPVELDDGSTTDTVELYRLVDPLDDQAVLPAAFPVGTLIVHETIHREEGHTVQVKLGDQAGEHADENGRDWYFGKFHDDGTPDEIACTPCSTCHNDWYRPGTDGLIGVPEEAL